MIVGMGIYMMRMQGESNRYELCHDYVGGRRDFIAACYDYIGSSLDAVETYPSNELEGISPAFILKLR